MKKNEVFELMKYVKAAYPLFLKDNDPDVVLDLWNRTLKDYEYEKVLENFIQYSQENEYPPKIKDLVEGLYVNERYNIPGVEETRKIVASYIVPEERQATPEYIAALKKKYWGK